MERPTLSVILPNYNHAHILGRALRAILQQEQQPAEILIIDDGSTDNSLEVIDAFARQHGHIRLLRHLRNQGVNVGINHGLEESAGDFLYFASADDFVAPGFFAQALNLARRQPEVGLVFGKMTLATEAGKVVEIRGVPAWTSPRLVTPQEFLQEYLEREPARHSLAPATLYRRRPLLACGGFPPSLTHWADTFIHRALGLGWGAGYLPQVAMTWQISPGSFYNRQDLETKLEIVRRAAALMRSPAFGHLFPAAHVRWWETAYAQELFAEQVIKRWRGLGWLSCRGNWARRLVQRLVYPCSVRAYLHWQERQASFQCGANSTAQLS